MHQRQGRNVRLTQSESNANEYAKLPIAALAKLGRINIEKGHARIVHGPTGKNVSAAFLPKLSLLEVRGKSIEDMAEECGLEKLYNIVFRIPAINAFLKAVALIADRFPQVTPADEILRTLGMNSDAGASVA